MKTHTSTFNRLIKQLQFKVDFTVDCEIEDLDSIEILEPSCNMEFVNRLIGFTADGKIITMQFDNDYDSLMTNDFRDIISSWDKMKVIEALEKALPTEYAKSFGWNEPYLDAVFYNSRDLTAIKPKAVKLLLKLAQK